MPGSSIAAHRWRFTWARRDRLTPYAFLLPSFAALSLVSFVPILRVLAYSLYSDAIGQGERFVGLDLYRAVIASAYFPRVLTTSVLWCAGNVAFVWALGLATAVMLNRRFPARGLVRALIILPWAIPYVAAGLVWGWIFDYEFGVLNYLLHTSGLASQKVGFLIACPEAFFSIAAASIWKLYPFGTVMFLAGLQTIPPEHYEAATVDGAGPVQAFWHVTLPGLRNVSVMLTLLVIIWSFGRAFTLIFLLTEGGPAGCTETIVIRSYLEAFKFFHIGTASAIGVIVLLISLAFSLAYLRLAYRKEGAHA